MSSRKPRTNSKQLDVHQLCQSCGKFVNCRVEGFVTFGSGDTQCVPCYEAKAKITLKPEHKLINQGKVKLKDERTIR